MTIPETVKTVEAAQEALARDGCVVLDCSDALNAVEIEDDSKKMEALAALLPWKILGSKCRASLAPTKIKMAVAQDGAVQAVTFGGENQKQSSRHLRHGADGNQSKTTNEIIDPLHVDGTKAYGYEAPDFIFLLCEQPCSTGGMNFLVDAAALVERSEDINEALFDTEVDQVYFSVTAAGKGVVRGTLANRTEKGRVLVQCPNVFEGQEAERVRPCEDRSDDLEYSSKAQSMISIFAERMRVAQNSAERFKLPKNHVLCVDNYRMWHGREPFEDLDRTLWRVWAWTEDCLGLPSDLPEGASTLRDCEV